MQILNQARAWLAELHPWLPAIALILSIWSPAALIRTLRPAWWEGPANWPFAKLGLDLTALTPAWKVVRKCWQTIPSVAGGAFLTAMAAGEDTWLPVLGASVGLGAPALHEVKALAIAAVKRMFGGPPAGGATLALALAFILGLSCTPAHWATQREAADVVSEVANKYCLPTLETAYRADGLMGVERARDGNEAQLYFIEWKARWLPVWAAWQVFAEAVSSWQVALNTEGDPLATGEAARAAFCTLKSHAAKAGATIPDFPLLGCTQ